jgi:hypothetical protein
MYAEVARTYFDIPVSYFGGRGGFGIGAARLRIALAVLVMAVRATVCATLANG